MFHSQINKRCRHDSLSLINLSALRIESGQTVQPEQSDKSTSPTGNNRPRAVVQHNYHDHAKMGVDSDNALVTRGGVATLFPIKLHRMLSNTEADGFTRIVGWQSHGRAFVVRKPKEFAQTVLPKYFGTMKFSSFQRQLNLYGFLRLTRGPDKGGYYHEMFLRGRDFLCYRIQRIRVKGTGARAASNPEAEPNFYSMESIEDLPPRRAHPDATVSAPLPALSHDSTFAQFATSDPTDIPDAGLDMDAFLKDIDFEDAGGSAPPNQESFSSLCSEDSALPTRMLAAEKSHPGAPSPTLIQPKPAAPPSTMIKPAPLTMPLPPLISHPQQQHHHAPLVTPILPKPPKLPQLDIEEMCFLQSLFGAKDVNKEPIFGGNANNATSAFHASSKANRPRQRKARTVIGRAA